MENITYKSSGVDIDEGNKAVSLIKEKVRKTYDKNVLGDIGNFGGLYTLREFLGMKEPVLVSSTDGVGTKLKIAQMMGIHNTIGIDLVAMCVNDIICQGAKPLFFLDYIATGKLDANKVDDIVSSIANGCKIAGCSLIGGETAEMPGMYSEDEYDLAGFAVGICDKENIIDGSSVKEDDVIIGIASSGIHSNGYSLVRKIFIDHLKWNLNDYIPRLGQTLGQALLRPTKIYVNLINNLLLNYKIKAIAHITGGGIIENIPRVIPEGLSCQIYKNSWERVDIFSLIESLNLIQEDELYRSFNMGIGLAIVVDKNYAKEILDYINTMEKAFIIGKIVKGEKGVILC
ncbi:phosphoribosylformylglycinamidine cyclo-ligase [Alkalithermobacter thermoalcaliphilus JW-YL-7 = DSM 7308]|uniref:Phosphoribosylformylglycinamidine cyclo-ligase n=1 Tax=Alkalithermobacter thermoalcaliphilus JW-YL-7 = DSM 7308 TaxID=1121328 RepID=A0A150FNB3_CLOPD|nr:phosphoribosylformylglycinamidine cyclo-ligase [[Clostridium] paradoxum JW-YL-7 = DSM 7308]SHK90867.1 phosphoribosylformylglycinamidine cyclo-ligase [[Clostridium] paradoxum JW-YL-7 = DSM 7308]